MMKSEALFVGPQLLLLCSAYGGMTLGTHLVKGVPRKVDVQLQAAAISRISFLGCFLRPKHI